MQTQLTADLDSVKTNLSRECNRYELQNELAKQGAVWAFLRDCLSPDVHPVNLSDYAKDGFRTLCEMMAERAQNMACECPTFDRDVVQHFTQHKAMQ